MKRNSNGNRNRVKTLVDGLEFDSKKEAKRYQQLKWAQELGQIEGLQRQVSFPLIPAQYEADIVGARGGVKKGKCIEREVTYIADFTYYQNGEYVVEDVKGWRKNNPDYRLFVVKRKLMLYMHNIRVKEV